MLVPGGFRRHCKPIAALLAITAVYAASRVTGTVAVPPADTLRFRFSAHPLPDVAGPESRNTRPVHPSLSRIQAWVSSVGASVALSDLDGNGLSDDVCYVDTRTDQVVVTPAPGTSARYAAFALPLDRAGYDRSTMAPMGCLPGDFNEDGAADLLVYFWGRPPVLFLKIGRESAPAAVGYVTTSLDSSEARWFSNAAALADFDGDGHADIVIGNYFRDGARILDAKDTGTEHMQHSMSRAGNGGGKHLFLSCHAPESNSVCFREAEDVLPAEARAGWTLAVGAADLDEDLLPEIYFANDFGPDRLLHNESTPGHPRFRLLEGRRTLSSPKSEVLGHDSFKGMGVDFADVNGDGIPDIFVSNIAAEYALEESNFAFISNGPASWMRRGIAPYIDRGEEMRISRSGWGWDVRLGDFDNDGTLEILRAAGFIKGTVNRWPELHELAMGNDQLLEKPNSWPEFRAGADVSGHDGNAFYVKASGEGYADLAKALGVDGPYVTRGIATADVDGDGRLDYAIANQWQPSILFHNEGASANAFLGLHLVRACEGRQARRHVEVTPGHSTACAFPVIGVHALVKLPDGRTMSAWTDGGSGHSGKRSPDVLLGLGASGPAVPVELRLDWRDAHGAPQTANISIRPGWHTVFLD